MKKVKVISIGMISILLIGIAGIWQYNRNNSSEDNTLIKNDTSAKNDTSVKVAKEVLKLNPLAISASNEKVSSVDIPDSCSNAFGKDVTAYKVKSHKYSKEEIDTIMKALKTDVKEEQKLKDGIEVYQLKNGAYMEYYENSGAISYISETDSDIDVKNLKKEINEKKCKKVADKFISETGIIDEADLEYVNMDVCETIETNEGTYPLTYEIYYSKKHPEKSKGFYGVGPGIKIEVDKDYNIRTFISVDKDVEEISGTYTTINEEEAVDKIYNGDGVQIDGSSEGDMGVSIDDVDLYLYCDPVAENQTYMAPYYVMDGKDEKGAEITITVPAIEDSMIEYVK